VVSSGLDAQPEAKLLWKIKLMAYGAKGKDTDNFVGVSWERIPPAMEPPPVAICPRLWVEDSGQACSAVALQPTGKLVWSLAVVPAEGEEQTWIGAEIGSDVPEGCAIILRDVQANRVVDLRRQARVEVRGSGERRFELQVVRTQATVLAVTSMAVQPVGAGAQIVFSLSASAYCDVEVLNIAGRTVRRVQQGRLLPAGQNVVVWDGRGDGGAPVPRGVYLVRLRARSEDGNMVQGIRTMSLGR
jgi:hypothetical protein